MTPQDDRPPMSLEDHGDDDLDDIVPDPSDALEFEPIRRARPKRAGLKILLAVIVLGGGAGAGWYYFGDKLLQERGEDIVTIRAPEGPVKVRPDTPGGMDIPDRDKLVYDRMKGADEPPRIERLLPPPETPLAPPAPSPASEQAAAQAKPSPAPEPKSAPATPPASAPQPKPVATPAPAAATAAAPTVQPSIADLVFRVQLAAVRSDAAAIDEWKRLQKKNEDLLGGLKLSVVRADLGPEKGIFYRLRAGPLNDEAEAKGLCEKLTERKVGCLIVRPGD